MGEKGQAIVEFTLVFPVQLLFTLGIMQYALIYNAKIVTEYAAFAAARAAAVYDDYDQSKDAAERAASIALGTIHHSVGEVFRFSGIPHSGPTTKHFKIYMETPRGKIRLQLYYDYPLIIPVIGHLLASPGSGFLFLGGSGKREYNPETRRHKSPHFTVTGYACVPKPWEKAGGVFGF